MPFDFLAEGATEAVGTGVVEPQEDEDGEGQDGGVDLIEGEYVEQRHGQGDVELASEGVGPGTHPLPALPYSP